MCPQKGQAMAPQGATSRRSVSGAEDSTQAWSGGREGPGQEPPGSRRVHAEGRRAGGRSLGASVLP